MLGFRVYEDVEKTVDDGRFGFKVPLPVDEHPPYDRARLTAARVAAARPQMIKIAGLIATQPDVTPETMKEKAQGETEGHGLR